ncbi:MAG: T9SS C-terminal target domain-containing protein [Balneolaceae bacterium]|nr:MAG: T9SS C-terminal target domain-containing protein [Balneolaceae bacterium]
MKTIYLSVILTFALGVVQLTSAQDVVLERVYPNISINNPVDLQHANDGSGRIFVVRQSGIIYVLGPDQSISTAPVFMNISSRVRSGGERGLLGLAFHPGYAVNGYFYVHYTAETGNQLRSVISRFSVDPENPDLGDPASELVLLEFDQPYSNHNAGQIAFGPEDGYLYIASGDGGSGGDPDNNGQDRTNLLGTIIRIDVDNTTGDLNYAIPASNPFVGNTDGFREEIYAWGLRNPWRMSFDPVTGWLWAADVGQNRIEEINLIENGGNYGWKIMEGTSCFSPSNGCDTTGLILPIWEYTHASGDGRSITGGYVYRGSAYPELQGKYFYSDYVSSNMWMLEYDGINEPVNTPLPNPGFAIASFGTDENEELYAMGHQNGQIYRIKIADAVPLPGTPVLISPDNGATGRQLELFFAWQAAADAETYRLQITSDESFDATDFDIQNISTTSAQVSGLAYATTYYWRVRARNETGSGEWSSVRSFTTEDEPLQAPEAPVLVSPEDDSTGLPRAVTFLWNTATGADTYALQLATTNVFDTPDIITDLSGLSDTTASVSDLAYESTYYWRVRAANEAGNGEWSSVRSFTTEDEPLQAPEAPDLVSPLNGSTDLDADLTLEWQSADRATTYTVEVSLDQDFSDIAFGSDDLEELRFPLASLEFQTTYYWRVRGVNEAGPGDWSAAWNFTTRMPVSVDRDISEIPESFELGQNFPNPFNPSTNIRFGVPADAGHVKLEVFDLLGRKVATLVDRELAAGWQVVTFNAENLNSGIYIYRLESANQAQVKKMVLVK